MLGQQNFGCGDLTSIVVGAAEERFEKQGKEKNCRGLDGLMVY